MKIAHIASTEDSDNHDRIFTNSQKSQTPSKSLFHYWAVTNILILLGWLIWVLFKKKQGRYKYALTKKDKKFFFKWSNWN
jgi:hypothetical protein